MPQKESSGKTENIKFTKKKKKITNIAKWLKIFANQNTVPPSGFKVRDRSRFSYISYTLVFIL